MLEQNGWKDKNIAEVMDEKYDWDIITEVQKKNARSNTLKSWLQLIF